VYSEEAIAFIESLFQLEPSDRPTAQSALDEPWMISIKQ